MAARCGRCQTLYDDAEERVFFRLDRGFVSCTKRRRQAVCIGCQITRRTERARARRALTKATDTLHRHATDLLVVPAEFARRYGWDVKRMAHDIEDVFASRCPYCDDAFADMEHGLADVSLDIVNPSLEPYYTTNTRWVCVSCNREKQGLSPEDWAIKLRAWAKWRANRCRPFNADSLFADHPAWR
jgi:hypothetical protein